MLPKSSESLKKPLFTITPSTTLLNLPNNLLSSQTFKEIVDQKSTVKIYYDDEIIEEKKNKKIKGCIDFNNKNNNNDNYEIKFNKGGKENEDNFIFKKKIKKEKKYSFNSEKINECCSPIYENNFKFDKKESKTKPIIQEENVETADSKIFGKKEVVGLRSNSCFNVLFKKNSEILKENNKNDFNNKIISDDYDLQLKPENATSQKNPLKEIINCDSAEENTSFTGTKAIINPLKHQAKLKNESLENELCIINDNNDNLNNSLLENQQFDNFSNQPFNKKNITAVKNNKQNFGIMNKYKTFSNGFPNVKNGALINPSSNKDKIIHEYQIVKKDLFENFKNTKSKNHGETKIPSLEEKNVFAKNKEVLKKSVNEQINKNKNNKNLSLIINEVTSENLESNLISLNRISNIASTGMNTNNILNNNFNNNINLAFAKKVSKMKLFETLNKEKTQIPNNFWSHMNKGNKELLRNNKFNAKSVSVRETFNVDNVNQILLSKLKFGKINEKQFSNFKYNSKGLFANFEKIKFSDFDNLLSTHNNNNKIINANGKLEALASSRFLSCKNIKQQSPKKIVNSEFLNINGQNKFKNYVINKCIYNDSSINNNNNKNDLVRFNNLNKTSTCFDNSILSKYNKGFNRINLTRSKANFNVISINDVKIFKIDLDYFDAKLVNNNYKSKK